AFPASSAMSPRQSSMQPSRPARTPKRSAAMSTSRSRWSDMKSTRIVMAAALVATFVLAHFALAHAQQQPVTRIDLQRHDLSAPGRETIQAIVEIAPGAIAPMHTHPGKEIIEVRDGTLEYEIGGTVSKVKAGDALFVPAGTPHSAKNIGTGRGAELATYVVEKDKPLISLVK